MLGRLHTTRATTVARRIRPAIRPVQSRLYHRTPRTVAPPLLLRRSLPILTARPSLLAGHRLPRRPVSFIIRNLVPRVVGNLVKVPLAFLGVGAGVATYANYKITQVTNDLTPDWLVDAAANARSWMQNRQSDLSSVDASGPASWFRDLFAAQQAQGSPTVHATGPIITPFSTGEAGPAHPPPSGESSGGGGGSSSSGNGGPGFNPPDPSAYSYYAAMADQEASDPSGPTNSGPDPPRPANQAEFAKLIKTLIEIQNILKTVQLDKGAPRLPSIVVIGSQSSGKSSVLEAIVGRSFLPKGSNMVTRRPIELTLVHTPHSTETYGEFPDLGLGRIRDFSQIQKTLTDLNLAVPDRDCVSDAPIDLRIYSASVPDLKLVDLPGYIQVHTRNQPRELKDKIRGLCERYIQAPNIILAVCAADVDLANSEALQASRRVDPLGLRTLGVITKMDTVEPELGQAVLRNQDYPLHLGYVGVVCKPVTGAHRGSSGTTSRLAARLGRGGGETGGEPLTEQQYFQLHPAYRDDRQLRLGVPTLRSTLVGVLESHMASHLTELIDNVQSELEEARYQFKVHYSDQRISAESYAMDTLDQLKRRFKDLTAQFGRHEIRREIRRMLEERAMDVCAQVYWDDAHVKQLAELTPHVLSALPAMHNYYAMAHPRGHAPSSSGHGAEVNGGGNGDQYGQPLYWQHKLERGQSLLTKSGVGRWSTQLIVDTLLRNLRGLVTEPPLTYHPGAQQLIMQFSEAMVRDRYLLAVEQVENTLKPLKYEAECSDAEWREARERTLANLRREVSLCTAALHRLQEQVGKRKLRAAMKHVATLARDPHNPVELAADSPLARSIRTARPTVPAAVAEVVEGPGEATIPVGVVESVGSQAAAVHNSSSETAGDYDDPHGTVGTAAAAAPARTTTPVVIDVDDDSGTDSTPQAVVYSPRLLDLARQALYLRHRRVALKYRLAATKFRACKSQANRVLCPEIFLHTLAAKLASHAVLFIQVELLNEFYFQFPRELDHRLYYGLTRPQIYQFARENPQIVHQLDLAERKAKLEEVMQKLLSIVHETSGSGSGVGGGSHNSARRTSPAGSYGSPSGSWSYQHQSPPPPFSSYYGNPPPSGTR
ncbi:mitochondrial dynamin GTPase Msp1 [Tieghemiomyces parasiticus]|uniref:dynamin GTPase n=1 Tax=Tieghemiomyces parasiticus TaxID=78921 RepID=A0A9W8AFT8_9FUNG|nr:mitochondrial dynamin GTPase Msp1 [Tieghemiomyces parasiticus]